MAARSVLLGAADAARERLGIAVVPLRDWEAQRERAVAAAGGALGDAGFDALYARGRALPFDRAVENALRDDDGEPSATRVVAAADQPLTRREREIAELISAGRTHREIAEALVLSKRTVEWHDANIMAKVGANSRAQLTAWAVRQAPRP